MDNFLLIGLAIVAGYVLQKLKIFPSDAPNTLNKFVIYISLPAMIFLQIPKVELSINMAIPIVIGWITISISALLVLMLSRWMNFSKEITGSLMLVAVLGNTSFLGIPIINAYFGADALPYVIVYDQMATFIALAVYGTLIVSIYSHNSELNVKIIVHKVVTFPPFLSLVVALFLIGVEFPPVLSSVLATLGATIVPLALVAVGLQLQLKLPGHEIKPFTTALFVKLIISPILAAIVCYILGWNGEVARISIMEAGMGPMITAGAVASMAGLAPRLSASILGYGILFAFFTTAVIYQLTDSFVG